MYIAIITKRNSVRHTCSSCRSDGQVLCILSYFLVCGREDSSEVRLTCTENVLTISWPTDVSYPATITDIPVPNLTREIIEKRLVDKGSMLFITLNSK